MSNTGVHVELRVLGPIEARDGHQLAVGGPRQRRILAALAMYAGEVVSVGRLAEIAWADGEPPDNAVRNVRSYVNRIREGLGDVADRLVTAAPGYTLELRNGELDAARFTAEAAAADAAVEHGDLHAALRHADRALACWHGRPYAEFADEPWAVAEVQRLEEVRVHLLERRCETLIDLGRSDDALAQLEVVIADHPYRERPRRLQMLALYHSGRGPEALRAFQEFRALLVDEVGLDPSTELVALDRRIAERAPELRRAPTPTRRARGYELHEIVGEGAFAEVWRATQPVLGREVVVKQIRAELADDPDFIRRFEVEARIVSMLEHPYIVPLYDFWREPGAAYLVFRMMAGGTLHQQLAGGPLGDDALRRLVEQIGAALRTAHRHGVVHRDVKPGNILVDADGNFFLTDFGIAFGAGAADDAAAAALSTGSPVYAAPEQLRREPLDARTDVYALGITLFEAATGLPPFADAQTRADLVERQLEMPVPAPSAVRPSSPGWLDPIITRATSKQPADRYASLDDLLADVRELARGDPADGRAGDPFGAVDPDPTPIVEPRNPFKGLDAFTEADADDFRGRTRLVRQLLAALDRPGSQGRFVVAVGPSGSGKSSVVRAGLLPELRRGAIAGSDDWFVTTMTPGAHPFRELDDALVRIAARPPGPLAATMSASERGIGSAVRHVVPDDTSQLLLVIDQFEELFTLVDDEDERRRFVAGLVAAVRDARSRVRVVATVRADFWDRPLRYPGLAALVGQSAVTVAPLSPDELEQVIVQPVVEQGMAYEPGLVARIVADVVDQPGALPLLQYALTQLYDRRVDGLLTIDEYDALGGVSGSVAQRAEEVYGQLTGDQRVAARRLFGRLVTLGEGSDDTRRRVALAELGGDPATAAVIEAYDRARLLAFDRDPATRGPTVEVAHEAVIREWPRLRAWIDEDRDGLRIHRHLTATARSWDDHGRDEGELYRGVRLEAAESWAAHAAAAPNPLEREFLEASRDRREEERRLEHRRLQRLRRLVVTVAAVAVLALGAGAVAWQSQRRADDEAARAESNAVLAGDRATEAEASRQDAQAALSEAEASRQDAEDALAEAEAARQDVQAALTEAETARVETDLARLRSAAVAEATEQPELAALLAVEAARLDPGRESDAALQRVLTAIPGYRGHLDSFAFPAWVTADGRKLVAAGRTFDVVDLTTMTLVGRVEHDRAGALETAAVSPDGRRAAITGQLGTRLFDLGTGERGASIDANGDYLEFSADSTRLALGVGASIELRDGETLELVGELPVGTNQSWRWTSADTIVVSGTDGDLTAWDVTATTPRWRITDGPVVGTISAMTATPDGERLLLAAWDAADSWIVAVSSADGTVVHEPTPTPTLMWSLAPLDAAGDRVLANGPGTATRTLAFDLTTGDEIESPVGGFGAIGSLYSHSLGLTLTWGNAGVDIWAADRSTPIERRVPIPESLAVDVGGFLDVSVAASPGAETIEVASVAGGGSVQIDLANSGSPAISPGAARRVVSAGPYVLADEGGTIVLRDADDVVISEPVAAPADLQQLAVTADGRFYAVARRGGSAELFHGDGSSAGTLRVPEATPGTVTGVSFSADGELVAMYTQGGSNARAVWRTDDLSIVQSEAGTERLRFLLAGDTLYTNRIDLRTIDRLDPYTLESVGPPLIGHASALLDVEFDGDLGLIATASADGTVRLWDEVTGRQFGAPVEARALGGIQFVDGGTGLVTAAGTHVSIWNLDTSTWPEIACRLAGRNLTREEWADFGPTTIDYRATCDQYPVDPV